MKRIALFLTLCLSFSIFVGCGSKKDAYVAPHDSQISLEAAQDDVLGVQEFLSEVTTKTENNITQTLYQMESGTTVEIDGVEFEGLTYTFENGVIASLNYYNISEEEDYDWSEQWDTVEAYFTKKYGKPDVDTDVDTEYTDQILEWQVPGADGQEDCYVRMMVIKIAKRFSITVAKNSYIPIT